MIEKFKLKRAHIKLLAGASVRWVDDGLGAPAIDHDAPYGASEEWEDWHAMAILVGGFSGGTLTDGEIECLLDLHRETQKALEVILSAKSFKPGVYYKKTTSGKWKLQK